MKTQKTKYINWSSDIYRKILDITGPKIFTITSLDMASIKSVMSGAINDTHAICTKQN